MGDRVLYQVIDSKKGEFSPVVYSHWGGSNAPGVLQCLFDRMRSRPGDLEYTAARLVQEVLGNDDGNTGTGIWNAEGQISADHSHGDAGVVLIDISDGMTFQCLGGYLKVGPNGKVIVPEGY